MLSHFYTSSSTLLFAWQSQVSGCEGGEVRVWDISSRRTCMKVEGCHRDEELTALAVDTEGGRILTGSRFGAIKV